MRKTTKIHWELDIIWVIGFVLLELHTLGKVQEVVDKLETPETPYTAMCEESEVFGYANGLVMAQRVLGEQAGMLERGIRTESEVKTCEQIVQELYKFGEPVASGRTKTL